MRCTHLQRRRPAGASRSGPTTIAALTCIALLMAMQPARAQSWQCTDPLLMQGKRTLFQRVLTRPGAMALDDPAGKRGQDLLAFSRLYVYGRRLRHGREWLRLGTDESCRNIVGWVDAAQTVPWRQQLSLALTNPSGRGRLLFFRDLEGLTTVADGANPAARARQIAETLDAGGHVPEVVAVEPDTFVDLHEQFYLLPILDTKEFMTHYGRKVRALKVAAVTRTRDRPPVQHLEPKPDSESMKDFRAAVVFVIDATVSMRPYIEETREAIDHFYRRIERAGLLDKVAFGLVGFRADVRDAGTQEQLGYVARVFASPTEVNNGSTFMQRIKGLKQAQVSTDFFDEDAYAGIDAALRIPDWTDAFNARFLVLVTDAGAPDGDPANRDPDARPGEPGRQSRTREDAATLQSRAASQGVAIAVMHLLTKQARDNGNIQRASLQYRELASNSDKAFNREAYFAIPGGSVEPFRGAVDAFANSLIDLMEEAKRGRVNPPGEAPIHRDTDNDGEYEAPPGDPGRTARLLGHAMLLAYLGERQQTTAPAKAFEAWITDADLRDPGLRTALPHVLMTRDQLSNLREIALRVIDIAEPTLGQEGSASSTKQFYEHLASIAAWFERREDGSGSDAATLSEKDLLLEYL